MRKGVERMSENKKDNKNIGHFLKFVAFSCSAGLIQIGSFTPVSYTHLDVYKRQDLSIFILYRLCGRFHMKAQNHRFRFIGIRNCYFRQI